MLAYLPWWRYWRAKKTKEALFSLYIHLINPTLPQSQRIQWQPNQWRRSVRTGKKKRDRANLHIHFSVLARTEIGWTRREIKSYVLNCTRPFNYPEKILFWHEKLWHRLWFHSREGKNDSADWVERDQNGKGWGCFLFPFYPVQLI